MGFGRGESLGAVTFPEKDGEKGGPFALWSGGRGLDDRGGGGDDDGDDVRDKRRMENRGRSRPDFPIKLKMGKMFQADFFDQ